MQKKKNSIWGIKWVLPLTWDIVDEFVVFVDANLLHLSIVIIHDSVTTVNDPLKQLCLNC